MKHYNQIYFKIVKTPETVELHISSNKAELNEQNDECLSKRFFETHEWAREAIEKNLRQEMRNISAMEV